MEAVADDFLFPPIFPGIDPDGDWYRFERWMRGEPVRQTLAEQLPETFTIKKPEEIGNADIEMERGRLIEALEKAGYGIGLNDCIPPRLVYAFLYEHLGETFELFEADGSGGFWTIAYLNWKLFKHAPQVWANLPDICSATLKTALLTKTSA